MTGTPPPEEYNGRAGVMRKSPWLAVEDIEGLDEVKLVIEKVYVRRNVEFENGRKEPVVYSLKFKGAERELILNAAKRKSLTQAYGIDTKTWQGKTVQLYVDNNVKLMGKQVKGIRIKAVGK